MDGRRSTDPTVIEKARQMVRCGQPWHSVAKELGVAPTSVHCWCDPEYAASRRAQNNRNRHAPIDRRIKATPSRVPM